jgi:hypothetical protein
MFFVLCFCVQDL